LLFTFNRRETSNSLLVKYLCKNALPHSAQFNQFGLPFSYISSTIRVLFDNNSSTIRDIWHYGAAISPISLTPPHFLTAEPKPNKQLQNWLIGFILAKITRFERMDK